MAGLTEINQSNYKKNMQAINQQMNLMDEIEEEKKNEEQTAEFGNPDDDEEQHTAQFGSSE